MTMTSSLSIRRRVGAACLFAGVAAATVAAPTAAAQPVCDASGFATTSSGVLNEAGGYLATHPDANNVLTQAASQPTGEAQSNVRGYFTSHPNEYFDLRNIAQPLIDLRNRCGVAVSPSQLATLFDALAD
jgi:heme-binding protein